MAVTFVFGVLSGLLTSALVIGGMLLLAKYGPPPPTIKPLFVVGLFAGVLLGSGAILSTIRINDRDGSQVTE